MKVAYVIPFDVSSSDALRPRLLERVNLWNEYGVETHLIACVADSHADRLFYDSLPCRVSLAEGLHPQLATRHIPRLVDSAALDIVYARYGLPTPGLARVSKAHPTVLEVHSDDLLESKNRSLPFRAIVHAFRDMVLRNAEGIVFVDPDLMEAKAFGAYSPRRCAIPNGILLDADKSARLRSKDNRSLRPQLVLVVGSNETWQGLDKLAELARLCPMLDFHVVGDAVRQESMSDNVTIHAQMRAEDLHEFLVGMDVGIGNLALERIGRRRPSPLKIRDYIRAGLPCILAHDDPDLNMNDSTLLNLGYDFRVTSAVADRVTTFSQSLSGARVSSSVANAVSLQRKERARIEFMADVLQAASR